MICVYIHMYSRVEVSVAPSPDQAHVERQGVMRLKFEERSAGLLDPTGNRSKMVTVMVNADEPIICR